jgi:inosine/xanthosine triphosphatase
MKVAVGSNNPVKKQAVHNTFSKVFGEVEVIMRRVDSGVPSQPRGDAVVAGARQRAERVRACVSNVDFGVGIESGLFDVFGVELDIQVCSVFDGAQHTIGTSPGFTYPISVLNQITAGQEVGHIMGQLSGIKRIGQKSGAVGYLSKGLIDRTYFTELCVIMALIPRMNSELYGL